MAGSLYAAAVCFRIHVSQFSFTDTVYGSSGRIDTDRGFQAGFKYCFTPGIHQTDFQRLRAGIQPGRMF